MNLERGVVYDDHARQQMRDRRITELEVEAVLSNYHTSYPAGSLPHTPERSVIYIGRVDDRDLKVYVLEGSDPPYIKTVVWRGDG